MLNFAPYRQLLLIRAEEKEAHDKVIAEIKENIKNKDFKGAYNRYSKDENIISYNKPLDFMKEVVKELGIDIPHLQKAVDCVAVQENMNAEEADKLMQDTMKTKEYKASV